MVDGMKWGPIETRKRISGTVAVVVTCPLEVVKTRLQSSSSFSLLQQAVVASPTTSSSKFSLVTSSASAAGSHLTSCVSCTLPAKHQHSFRTVANWPASGFYSIYRCISYILQTEGALGLFRGIGPTIVGVAPHKAIYFYTYNVFKKVMARYVDRDSPVNHVVSAGSASFVAASFTNPIWFIKTRLQLDCKRERLTVTKLIRDVYRAHGIRGFYRGVTASYYGVSETMIYFVTYEKLRLEIGRWRGVSLDEERRHTDYAIFMLASALSKSTACCLAYPHEVARTRMREENNRYQRFWQTLRLVYLEEGTHGLYRGLFTSLVRQIPNAAISMATFETVAYYLQS